MRFSHEDIIGKRVADTIALTREGYCEQRARHNSEATGTGQFEGLTAVKGTVDEKCFRDT